MTAYNTGTTFSATNITAATAFTGTIPAGVAAGDVMIVSVNVFSFSQTPASVSTPTSGGGSWTQIGTLLTGSQGAVVGWASAWYRVATAGDPGSTFSMSWTGGTGGGNQFWWAADLEAYTGFYTASPIGNFNTVVSSATTVVAPSTTTARSGSWAVYTCPTSVSGSGTITAAPATSRHIVNPGAGVDNAISDSAGSAGGAGTAIGGGTFTLSGSSSGDGISFTIELCTVAPTSSTAQTTPPRIPHPLWFDLLEVAASRADWQAQGVATPAAFTWRLMDGVNGRPGSGPGTATANSTGTVLGTGFYVTQGGMWFTGYWWWVCPAGGQPTSPQKFALWNVTSQTTGMVVPGSAVISGTLTSGWNWVPLPQPVQLAIWGYYTAATQTSGPFPDTASQFGAGQPYAAGISNGPLSAFSDAGASNAPPYSRGQGCLVSGSDPAVTLPVTNPGTHDNVWLDVQVTNVPPAGYSGSYRLWPNMADGDFATGADSAVNYVIGTEVILSQACYVNAIWYYLPAGTVQLATSADIWRVRDGVRVATQPTPTWCKIGGGKATATSGLAGGSQQWAYTQLPGPVYLPPGDYYITVYNSAGSPDGWGAKRLYYWEAGTPGGTSYQAAPPGAAGITSGPLYAPPTPLASGIQDYENNANVEPGQSVFAVGPPNQFPNRYVGGSSGGGTGPALFQNYWIDVEVTPTATWTPDAPDLPQRLPHPYYMRLLEVAAYRDAGAPPPAAPVSAAAAAAGAGLAAAAAIQIAPAAAAAAGSAVAVATVITGAAAAGAGSVTAVATQIAGSAAAGAGTAGSPAATQIAAATAAAAGSVTDTVTQIAGAAGAGAGSASASGSGGGAATASIAGAAAVTAVVTQIAPATAAGAAAVTATATQAAKATSAGASAVTAAGQITGTAAVTGTGAVTAVVTQPVTGTAAGAGLVTTTTAQIAKAAAAGAGAVTGAGQVVIPAVFGTPAATGTILTTATASGGSTTNATAGGQP